MRSDRTSACTALRRSSPRAVISSTATCRRAIYCRRSSSCRWRSARGRTPSGAGRSALQQLELVLDAFPLLGVRRRLLHLADHRPFLRELRVELLEVFLAGGDLFLGIDGLDRTLGFAQR